MPLPPIPGGARGGDASSLPRRPTQDGETFSPPALVSAGSWEWVAPGGWGRPCPPRSPGLPLRPCVGRWADWTHLHLASPGRCPAVSRARVPPEQQLQREDGDSSEPTPPHCPAQRAQQVELSSPGSRGPLLPLASWPGIPPGIPRAPPVAVGLNAGNGQPPWLEAIKIRFVLAPSCVPSLILAPLWMEKRRAAPQGWGPQSACGRCID